MDKIKICEAMYALPNRAIVRRRKSVAVPVILFFAGVGLLMLNRMMGGDLNMNLRSALVFLGGGLALTGIIMTLVRRTSAHGVPYHSDRHCYLRYEELCFEPRFRDAVAHYVDNGDLPQILSLKQTHVPAVTVALYRTPDNNFAAMQAFEYSNLEYKPITELRIFDAQLQKAHSSN